MRRAAFALLATLAASVLAAPSWADPAVAWGDCAAAPPVAGVLCGTLTVPEARDAAMPRLLALPVTRLPAAFVSDAPPLVVVGMRHGLVPMPLDADTYALLALLAKDRDVVVLEPRGLGGTRLDCDLGDDPEALLGPVFPPEAVAACHADLAARADLTRYTDADIALDLADLIAALGAAQADVLAFTAGGRAALALAGLRPAAVRRVILVSPISPGEDWPSALTRGADNARQAMSRVCLRSKNCNGISLERRLVRNIAALDKKPAAVTVDMTGTQADAMLTGEAFALGFHLATMARASFVLGPDIIRRTSDDDPDPAAQIVGEAHADLLQGALGLHLALVCSAERNRLAEIDPQPFKGIYVGDRWATAYRAACEAWPGPSAGPDAAPPSLPPTLLVLPAFSAMVSPEDAVLAFQGWVGELAAVEVRSLVLASQLEDWPSEPTARACAGNFVAAYLGLGDPTGEIDDKCVKDLPRPVLELGEPEAP